MCHMTAADVCCRASRDGCCASRGAAARHVTAAARHVVLLRVTWCRRTSVARQQVRLQVTLIPRQNDERHHGPCWLHHVTRRATRLLSHASALLVMATRVLWPLEASRAHVTCRPTHATGHRKFLELKPPEECGATPTASLWMVTTALSSPELKALHVTTPHVTCGSLPRLT